MADGQIPAKQTFAVGTKGPAVPPLQALAPLDDPSESRTHDVNPSVDRNAPPPENFAKRSPYAQIEMTSGVRKVDPIARSLRQPSQGAIVSVPQQSRTRDPEPGKLPSALFAALFIAILLPAPADAAGPMSYLDNGVIRLGVDLGKGGTITYLANSGPSSVNVVNSYDLGREVQQSYYSGPDNYGNPAPPWTNFPWNPIGAGDAFGNPAIVLDQSNDGRILYTKTAPLQWALNHVGCECVIEQWITLDGNSAQIRNRLTNNRSDRTTYHAYGQELPAVYTNGTFWRLFTYSGDSPYAGGPLTQIANVGPPAPWPRFSATEHWAALVDDSGYGLGVINALVTSFIGGSSGALDAGGPSDITAGYIAPNPAEILDWNIVYEYDYTLVLGTLDQIRAYAAAHRPDDRPDYQFTRDRQHFSLVNAIDMGWPISGSLHVNLDQIDPYIVGPEQWWQAKDVPRLYITAAYRASGTNAQFFWSVPGQGFAQERSVYFAAIPDGQYHTYTLDLSTSPTYQGTITGLRFDPSDGSDPGGYVEIASVSWRPPELVGAINHQGLWWNSPPGSESGWGINVAHEADQVFATWYTYDTSGKAWWLSMLGNRTTPTRNVYSGPIYVDLGPPFNNFVGAGSATQIGTGTVSFTDANNGGFTYSIDGTSQSKAITRFDLGTGPQPTCVYSATTPNFAAATNYQDLWWVTDGAEPGWGVNLAHQGDSLFATWYTYNFDGTPLWLSALVQRQGASNIYTGPIYQNSGPRFDAYNIASVVVSSVGTATLTFADGNDAIFEYSVMVEPLPGPVTQAKKIVRFRFAASGGTVCQ